MHPLSIFPELLNFPLVGYLLLRLTAGLFILYVGWERYHKPYNWIAVLNLVSGALIIAGLYTQMASIAGIILLKTDFLLNNRKFVAPIERIVLYVAMIVILLSLLVTGPGFWAFDLPL